MEKNSLEMKEQQMIIIDYLENTYSGAKMMDDEETMIRVARALAAFKADPYSDEVFHEKFMKKIVTEEIDFHLGRLEIDK